MTDTPSHDAAPLYMLALPTRTEGPYSVEELRSLLREGHVRPTDRVEQVGARRGATVAEIIPDAASIQVSTDRVVRRYRTPAPGIVAEQAAAQAALSGEAAGAAPSAVPQAARPRLPKSVVAVLACVVFALGLLSVLWQGGLFDAPPPVVPMVGWTVTFDSSTGVPSTGAPSTGAAPQGGPWELCLREGKMVVTAPDHSITTHALTQGKGSGANTVYQLAPPHPKLGATITISDADPVVIEAAGARGKGRMLPANETL